MKIHDTLVVANIWWNNHQMNNQYFYYQENNNDLDSVAWMVA